MYLLYSFLLSISPLGEARAGIPYAIMHDIDPLMAYLVCTFANILAFPVIYFFLSNIQEHLFKYRPYKKAALRLGHRAKNLTGNLVQKYGFWGLMVFVMIPMPGTGAYMGSIAAWILGYSKKEAFKAITIGIIISGILVEIILLSGFEIVRRMSL